MTIATVDQILITADNRSKHIHTDIGDIVRIVKVSWHDTKPKAVGGKKNNHGKAEYHYAIHVIHGSVKSLCHWRESDGTLTYTFATLAAARRFAGMIRDGRGALLLPQPMTPAQDDLRP